MTATRISINDAIEQILVELAEENTYINGQSIPVLTSSDADTDIEQLYVVAHATAAQEHEAGTGKWWADIAYHVLSHMADDESQGSARAAREELMNILTTGFVTAANATTAQSGSGVTVDGIVIAQTDDGAEGNYWRLTSPAKVYCTVIPRTAPSS